MGYPPLIGRGNNTFLVLAPESGRSILETLYWFLIDKGYLQ